MSSGGKPLVVLAFANPDSSRRLWNLEREEQLIQAALAPLVTDRRLDRPVTITNASIDRLAAVMQAEVNQRRVRAFHYGGHADDAMLMLTGDAGAPTPGHARGLADFLARQEGLELVVLNGCSTQAHIDRLRELGVKAVVATSSAIMDDVAADFAAKLYAGLATKPLKAAFREAESLLRGKKGEDPRAFVHGDAVVTADWQDEWPWVLSCDPQDEEWTLMTDKVSEKVLVDQLAMVLHDLGMANVVVGRIGFPRGRVPHAPTAWEFWTSVVGSLRSGTLEAKEQALIDEVAELFPGNPFFRRLRSKL